MSEFVTSVEELAQLHGCSKNAGPTNSLALLERRLAELEEAEQKVRELGYKSLNAALFGLSKQNRYPNVPADLQHVPEHWVKEQTFKSVRFEGKSRTVTVSAVTATQARQKLNKLLPYLNELLEGADTQYVNDVREDFTNPKTTFDDFAENVHRNLAEDAGLGTTWDTEALPPAETTATLPEATTEDDLDAQALESLSFLQTVKPNYGTLD